MREFSVEIDGETYEGQTASATKQFEALHICGRTRLVGLITDQVKANSVAVYLLNIPFDDVKSLRDLLLKGSVFKEQSGTDKGLPVAENLFADKIHNYYLLLAKVILENLQGFSELRGQTAAQAAEQSH